MKTKIRRPDMAEQEIKVIKCECDNCRCGENTCDKCIVECTCTGCECG